MALLSLRNIGGGGLGHPRMEEVLRPEQAGADALAETGQGFGNYLMTLGVIETVALFVLVFIRASFT